MKNSEAAEKSGNAIGERYYAGALQDAPRRTPSFETPPFAPPYPPSRTSSISSLSSSLGRFSKLPLIPRRTSAAGPGQSVESPLKTMGVHVRDDSVYSHSSKKMTDIDGYSQSQRDFYTIKPHLYAQQPVKNSQGPQPFNVNPNDARETRTNGSMTPTNLARPSQVKVVFDMTKEEIELTQKLWSDLMSDPESLEQSTAYGTPTALFCEQFYTNLMASHAELASIFPSIKRQSVAVAGVFGLAISSLERIEEMDEFLRSVGKRHNRMIGVEPIHYRWLGEAMVKTFADRFGDRFTLEVETAWIKIYSYLAHKLLASDEEPNVLMFAPQQQPRSMLSSSPNGPGISPTPSYTSYQTTQDVRKPSLSSSINSQSLYTSTSNNSTAPTSVVNSPNAPSIPATPTANNAPIISARRNVSTTPSIPPSLPSAPAPTPKATDYSPPKNVRGNGGRKQGRKGKDGEKCVLA